MDLTPETLRSATFRDKLRGYHPDDVDEFLESVARGLEVLLARLRDASEKARAVAQPGAAAAPQADEAVRTLSLAQRTADLAIHEAKAEAEKLLRAAEQRSRRVVGEAEEEAIRLAEAAQAELRADLEKLQSARDQLFGEVNNLRSWVQGERGRIKRALTELADRVETVRDLGDQPQVKTPTVPKLPRQKMDEAKAKGASRPTGEVPAVEAQATPAQATPAQPAPAQPAERPAPPVERPKAAATPPRGTPATPPAAAPLPRQPTPPGGQPAVTRLETPAPPLPPQGASPSDSAVLQRAQDAFVTSADDDDPFFAELRQAMNDKTPLGPRDDWESGSEEQNPPQMGKSF